MLRLSRLAALLGLSALPLAGCYVAPYPPPRPVYVRPPPPVYVRPPPPPVYYRPPPPPVVVVPRPYPY